MSPVEDTIHYTVHCSVQYTVQYTVSDVRICHLWRTFYTVQYTVVHCTLYTVIHFSVSDVRICHLWRTFYTVQYTVVYKYYYKLCTVYCTHKDLYITVSHSQYQARVSCIGSHEPSFVLCLGVMFRITAEQSCIKPWYYV